MSSRSVVAVYRDVSQVDEPVFAALAAQGSMDVEVIYWNNYGLERSQPDPELGVVPVFPNSPLAGSRVKRRWLDSRSTDSTTLCRSIIDRQPGLVILNDLGSSAKFGLATGLRSHGVTVGFRSDKNLLSEGARRGPPRFIEQMAYRAAFNLLFPISELTRSYYGWPQGHASLFPYCTDTAKFAPADRGARRQAKREALGIKDGVHVLLAVTKFAQREDPLEVLRVFQEVRRRRDDVILVMVGSGPLFRAVQATASDAGLKTAVHLAGYVPYAELQDYFFCADLFLHFPQREP
ncbi:MAG TPA: glycosyltransferase, partial [Sphingomicrobium sp.]|nr:glycosyltransferase [Sphingomicrobium sp.]